MKNCIHISRYTIIGPSKYRFLVVTDMHNTDCKQLCAKIIMENPDIVFLVGDMFSGLHLGGKEKQLKVPFQDQKNVISFLLFSTSISKVILSLGNHEYQMSDEMLQFIQGIGVTVLENSWINYEEFCIGGLSYERKCHTENPKSLILITEWLEEYKKQPGYHIMLSHHPELWRDYLSDSKIELTISGHAHGGQWRFLNKGFYAPNQGFFPKYTKGLYENGRLLVSAGVTNTYKYLPRINNPCEILVVEMCNNQVL